MKDSENKENQCSEDSNSNNEEETKSNKNYFLESTIVGIILFFGSLYLFNIYGVYKRESIRFYGMVFVALVVAINWVIRIYFKISEKYNRKDV